MLINVDNHKRCKRCGSILGKLIYVETKTGCDFCDSVHANKALKKIKRGYKVVKETELGFLMSSSQNSIVHHGARTYIPKRKTFPLKGFGPLAVFTNLEAAKKYKAYMASRDELRIFTCEYEESEMDYVFDKVTDEHYTLQYLINLYMRYLNISDVASASWVKIIKEV